MAVYQGESKRKVSGGLLKRKLRKKAKSNLGRAPSHTKIGEMKKDSLRIRSGELKQRLFQANVANLFDPKSKKYSKAKIISVKENPASRHFVRMNIVTKGAVIETDKGLAKVT